MIYLDTSAIVKLIVTERESAALTEWLRQRASEALVTSTIAEVEVPRALRRCAPRVLGAVAATLSRLARVEVDPAVRATAAAYAESSLRSLDAIHLASADILVASGKPLTAFVTYDKRLAEVARDSALTVVAPA